MVCGVGMCCPRSWADVAVLCFVMIVCFMVGLWWKVKSLCAAWLCVFCGVCVDVCVFVCVGVACGKREDPLMCYEE